MTHPEIQESLGVYALDAVEGEERRIVEHHLATCPECRFEVVEHREVAARLASVTSAGPVGLWTALQRRLTAPCILLEDDDREGR